MAPNRQTPTVRLRRLAAELRKLRAAPGLSREYVCEETSINYATLYRVETARSRPQLRTLKALLTLYGTEPEQRDYLVDLCRNSATPGWLRPYHSDLPEVYAAYISFEDEAAGVRDYESLFIPGLLQTADYTRALIRGMLPTATDGEVQDRLRARMERQAVLTRDDPLTLWSVIDEAALHRVVGGPAVQRAQLGQLAEAAGRPNVTVQVIPFRAGAHPGMPGQFAIMDFADPMDDDLVHIDGMAGDMILESEGDIAGYGAIFDTLRAVALSPADSTALITELANRGG